MSTQWPDKYIIGLTGTIAAGKSVVRKMLEHLGAYGIDADALSHRAISKGAPGYQPVVDAFGKWILRPDGQIDRQKLGRLVFNDSEALEILENIVHPLVKQAIGIMIRRAKQKVIVIEAIKLVDTDLQDYVDTTWVVYASPQIQIARMVEKRGMSLQEAQQRLSVQNMPEQKAIHADVVIRNDGSFAQTWQQVHAAWKQVQPGENTGPTILKKEEAHAYGIERGRPKKAAEIAAFINQTNPGQPGIEANDVLEAFGEKAFLLLTQNQAIKGLAGWQVENLVARITDIHLDKDVNPEAALKALLPEIEQASRDLQCEAALLFLPPKLAAHASTLTQLGYEARTIESLSIQAWEDAARESQPAGTTLFFKQLRQDRILRPI